MIQRRILEPDRSVYLPPTTQHRPVLAMVHQLMAPLPVERLLHSLKRCS